MDTLWKWTDAKYRTYAKTQWDPGITHFAGGGRNELCNNSWLHAYRDPLTALLMDPIGGSYTVRFESGENRTAVLWECVGEVGLIEMGKVGCTQLTTIKTVDWPKVTDMERVAVAFRLARTHFSFPFMDDWLEAWFGGERDDKAVRVFLDWSASNSSAAPILYHMTRLVHGLPVLNESGYDEFVWAEQGLFYGDPDRYRCFSGWQCVANVLGTVGHGMEPERFRGELRCALQMFRKAESA